MPDRCRRLAPFADPEDRLGVVIESEYSRTLRRAPTPSSETTTRCSPARRMVSVTSVPFECSMALLSISSSRRPGLGELRRSWRSARGTMPPPRPTGGPLRVHRPWPTGAVVRAEVPIGRHDPVPPGGRGLRHRGDADGGAHPGGTWRWSDQGRRSTSDPPRVVPGSVRWRSQGLPFDNFGYGGGSNRQFVNIVGDA
jgi:hypothetical protein